MDAIKTGTLIAQARREKGMTQKELSELLLELVGGVVAGGSEGEGDAAGDAESHDGWRLEDADDAVREFLADGEGLGLDGLDRGWYGRSSGRAG